MKALKFLIFLLFPFAVFSQTDNSELQKMYNEDQSSRMVKDIDWTVLSKQDKEMLEDYLVTVLNKAIAKATNVNEAEMAAVAQSGMPSIPGMDMFK